MNLQVSNEHLAERVQERGEGYALALEPAITSRGNDYFVVDTEHPAFLALELKYAPSPERSAAAQAALIRRFRELWDAIHDLRDPTPEKLERITNLIPCGDCKTHWQAMLVRTPPDFTSLEGYRRWSVKRHNEVSISIGKLPMSYPEVAAARGWPTP